MGLKEATKERGKLTKAREIIFVDDDKEELGIFRLAIKDLKIPVNLQYAKSGDDLFKLLEQATPDLLFLDLHLPGKSGITCLKMLRYTHKYDSLPIIIYSRLSTDLLVDDCYEAKANFYLVKPVSVKNLGIVINKIIETNWESGQYTNRDNFVIR